MSYTKSILVAAVLILCVSADVFTFQFQNKINAVVHATHKRAANANTCFALSCATLGQNCAASTTIPICTSDNTYCDGASSTCKAQLANGAACLEDNYNLDCLSGNCENAVCIGGQEPGETCTNNDDCDFTNYTSSPVSYTHQCTNGKCYGIAAGASCDFNQCVTGYVCGTDNTCVAPYTQGQTCNSGMCASGLSCYNDVCTSPLAKGAACSVNNDICALGLTCAPSNSDESAATCIDIYTGAAGAFCANDDNCGDGLYCNGTCMAGSTGSLKACTADSDCAAGETCACQYSGVQQCVGHSGNPTGIRAAVSNLFSCVNTNCGNNIQNEQCVANNCRNQACSYFNLEFGTSHYPSCFTDYLRKSLSISFFGDELGCSSTSGAGIVVPSLLAVAAIAAIVM